jgi:hypothetical protein
MESYSAGTGRKKGDKQNQKQIAGYKSKRKLQKQKEIAKVKIDYTSKNSLGKKKEIKRKTSL